MKQQRVGDLAYRRRATLRVMLLGGLGSLFFLVWSATTMPARNALSWVEDSFEDFNDGELNGSGINLYATRKGTIEVVTRFDLNGDGYLDLVFNSSHDYVTAPRPTCFELSTGRQRGGICDLPAYGTKYAAVSDLNRDGFLDLVLCPNDDWVSSRRYLTIFWGEDKGWSGKRMTSLITIAPRAVQLADVNGDGWEEIIVLNGTRWAPDDGPESVLRIYWASPESFSHERFTDILVPQAQDFKIQDLDGNGQRDLSILLTDPALLAVYWDKDIGYWDAKIGGSKMPPPFSLDLKIPSASRFELTDSNQDGWPDFFILGGEKQEIGRDPTTGNRHFRYSQVLRMLSKKAPRQWNEPQSTSVPFATFMSVSDLNKNGLTDIILTDRSSERESVWILWGDEKSPFHKRTRLPIGYSSAVAIEDLDEDGNLDLAIGVSRGEDTYEASSRIFYGDGRGDFELAPVEIPTADVTDVVVAPGPGKKGHRLVFCNNIAGRLKEDVPVKVYWGGPEGFEAQRVSNYSLRSGYVSSAADLDQDGYTDLILASIYHISDEQHPGEGFNILWGGKDGLRDDRRTVLREYGLIGFSVADVNRDGYLDLVGNCSVSTPEGAPPGLVIWLGGPTGFVADRRIALAFDRARGQNTIADFNKDGYLDIAVAGGTANRISILWGGAQGFSQQRQSSWALAAVQDIKVADLNADGWLELIAGTYRLPGAATFDLGTYIYWGGPGGFDPTNVQRLPTHSGVGISVADWDADGYLDIFVPNYHYGVTRESVASHLYWGSSNGYSQENRTDLMTDSGHGSMAADFDGDGRIDLAVSCHSKNGTHLTNSKVFYNDGRRFHHPKFVELPTAGSHYMHRVDLGNVYDRTYRETYVSSIFTWDESRTQATINTLAQVPGRSRLQLALRFGSSKEDLLEQPWHEMDGLRNQKVKLPPTARRLQYRAVFLSDNGDRYPVLDWVEITFEP